MTQPQAEIAALAKKYQQTSVNKYDKSLKGLHKMKDFYRDKYPEAPEFQSTLFRGYVITLEYAIEVIENYDKLTQKLAQIVRESE